MKQINITIKGERVNRLVGKLRRKYGKKYCFTKGNLSVLIIDVILYGGYRALHIIGYLSILSTVRLVNDQTCNIKIHVSGHIDQTSVNPLLTKNLEKNNLKGFLRTIKNLCKKNSWSCEGIDIFKATKMSGRDILLRIIIAIGLILAASLLLAFLYAIIQAVRTGLS